MVASAGVSFGAMSASADVHVSAVVASAEAHVNPNETCSAALN